MPTSAATLQDLAQSISQQEAQLAKLRLAYEARQVQLTELQRRKEELQAQLRLVDTEIQAVGQVSKPKPPPAKPVKPSPPPAAKPASGLSLPQLLVELVRQAKRPLTIKELSQEVVRRKYPTTTHNIPGLIKSRVSELLKKGILRRLGEQPGVTLAQAGASSKPVAAKAPGALNRNGQKKATASKPTVPAKSAEPEEKQTLPALLIRLLAKSTRPLKARELADLAVANGYQTKSRDFTNVIWVAVSKINGVENVPGKGYRLKKGKGK